MIPFIIPFLNTPKIDLSSPGFWHLKVGHPSFSPWTTVPDMHCCLRVLPFSLGFSLGFPWFFPPLFFGWWWGERWRGDLSACSASNHWKVLSCNCKLCCLVLLIVVTCCCCCSCSCCWQCLIMAHNVYLLALTFLLLLFILLYFPCCTCSTRWQWDTWAFGAWLHATLLLQGTGRKKWVYINQEWFW